MRTIYIIFIGLIIYLIIGYLIAKRYVYQSVEENDYAQKSQVYIICTFFWFFLFLISIWLEIKGFLKKFLLAIEQEAHKYGR